MCLFDPDCAISQEAQAERKPSASAGRSRKRVTPPCPGRGQLRDLRRLLRGGWESNKHEGFGFFLKVTLAWRGRPPLEKAAYQPDEARPAQGPRATECRDALYTVCLPRCRLFPIPLTCSMSYAHRRSRHLGGFVGKHSVRKFVCFISASSLICAVFMLTSSWPFVCRSWIRIVAELILMEQFG